MADLADNTPEAQGAAGSSSTPSQAASAPHPSTLSASRRGSAAFLATQPEHAASSPSTILSDPNALNSQGFTPLIQAFQDGNLEEFKRLLNDDRVDVNRPDAYHRSPLLAACMGRSHFGIGPEKTQIFVEELLKKSGVDVNAANRSALTPLHAACRQDAHGAVKALLKADGIVVDARNDQNETPLDIAFGDGNEELITVLFENSSAILRQTDEDHRTLLHRLIEYRLKNAIPALLALAPELVYTGDNSGRTPLHDAAQLENPAIIQMLLALDEVNVNPIDQDLRTPLHLAAYRGCTRSVEALLGREGVNLNARDMQNRTPLHYAIFARRIDTIKALLKDERVNVNSADGDGGTPLHFAARVGDVEIGKLLLARGDLDLSAKQIGSRTTLHVAVDRSPSLAMEMLKVPYELDENGMLAEKSLRPDEADSHKITPLRLALYLANTTNDPERRTLVKQLLNDPRVDSNQMLDLFCTSDTQTWPMVLDNLEALGFERSQDSLLAVLHGWANKRPVGVRQNQALAAKTNFYLGMVYRFLEVPGHELSDVEKLEFQSKAVFHHGLALEQLLKHPEQSERLMGLDHTETVDGMNSISHYARTLLNAVSAEDALRILGVEPPSHAIWNTRTEPFQLDYPDTHAGEQFAATFDLTEHIITDSTLGTWNRRAEPLPLDYPAAHTGDQYEATLDVSELPIKDVTPTETVNIGGICVPRADIEDLANGRGHKAMQLALLADERVERERNVHQIGHLMTGAMMLNAVRGKNAATIARLNDASSSSAAAQTHVVPPFAVAADQARAAIARTEAVYALNHTPSDATRARRVRLRDAAAAIDRIADMPAGGAVTERELSTTVHDVFREMWFYIQNSPNEMRQNLEEAFFDQVADMWDKSVATPTFFCLTGCVQRLLTVPHHIDPSLMTATRNLSPEEMTSALRELARDVLRPIRVASHLAGIPETVEEDEPLAGDAEILKVKVNTRLDVEREIFEATAREVMIGFRGWEDSPKVREAIEIAKENIEYISMVTEDTQEA